jgi:hypothetical protein
MPLAAARYKSGPSKLWLKTKNVTESELLLLGVDRDKEGKPIAYLGPEAKGELLYPAPRNPLSRDLTFEISDPVSHPPAIPPNTVH